MKRFKNLAEIHKLFIIDSEEESKSLQQMCTISFICRGGTILPDEKQPSSDMTNYLNRSIFGESEGNILYLAVHTSSSTKDALDYLKDNSKLLICNCFGVSYNSIIKNYGVSELPNMDKYLLFRIEFLDAKKHKLVEEGKMTFLLKNGNNDVLLEYSFSIIDSKRLANLIVLRNFRFGLQRSDQEYTREFVSFKEHEENKMLIQALVQVPCSGDSVLFNNECNIKQEISGLSELEYVVRIVDENGKEVYVNVGKFLNSSTNNYERLINELIDISELDNGTYSCLFFLADQLIINAPFSIGVQKEGNLNMYELLPRSVPEPNRELKGSEALDALNAMVGLKCIKETIFKNLNYVKFIKAREAFGLPTPKRLMHTVMTGNPGTGKTTVARLLGTIYHEMGLLSKGHLVEVNREVLTDSVIGGSEKRTKACIEQAKGGILFVDEAYSLTPTDEKDHDFGRQVIDTLMPYLSDPQDLIVVFAGYPDEMSRLLNSNPGLSSRFPIHFHFKDYTVDELVKMTDRYLSDNKFRMTDEAWCKIKEVFKRVVKLNNFGNGRFVKTFMENGVLPNVANRLAGSLEDGEKVKQLLCNITEQDIPTTIDQGLLEAKSRGMYKPVVGFAK